MRMPSPDQHLVVALPRAAAARVLRVSLRTLERLIQAGAIKTVLVSRRRLVTVKELNRFLAEGGYVEELPEHGGR